MAIQNPPQEPYSCPVCAAPMAAGIDAMTCTECSYIPREGAD